VDDVSEDGDECLERGGVEKEADDVLFNWYILNRVKKIGLMMEASTGEGDCCSWCVASHF
jgi:hypothetical protein